MPTPSATRPRKHHGFTLIEMIVAIAVAAILGTLAAAGFSTMVKNNTQATTSNLVLQSLMMARGEAIKRGQNVAVCASPNGSSCAGGWAGGLLVFVDTDEDEDYDDGEAVVSYTGAIKSRGIDLKSNVDVYTFRPYNQRSDAGRFTICDDRGNDYGSEVVVSASGRARTNNARISGNAVTCL